MNSRNRNSFIYVYLRSVIGSPNSTFVPNFNFLDKIGCDRQIDSQSNTIHIMVPLVELKRSEFDDNILTLPGNSRGSKSLIEIQFAKIKRHAIFKNHNNNKFI